MRSKKAISPVVATAMLIALVIVLAVIVAVWFSSFTKEEITKNNQNIKLVCRDVSFKVTGTANSLEIQNLGTIPIYNFDVIVYKTGKTETLKLNQLYDGLRPSGLEQGSTVSLELKSGQSGITKLKIIPILFGVAESGRKSYACDDSHGKTISF